MAQMIRYPNALVGWAREDADPSVGIMAESMFHDACADWPNGGSCDLTDGEAYDTMTEDGFQQSSELWVCRDCGIAGEFLVEHYVGTDTPEEEL